MFFEHKAALVEKSPSVVLKFMGHHPHSVKYLILNHFKRADVRI